MAHQLTAIYAPPVDPAAFDRHDDEVHAPLAAMFPGLRSFTIHRPGPGPDGGPPAAHLVAVLTFDSEDALNAALSGPAGQAAVADLDNFAQAGVTILTGPVEVVVRQ
ncbi:EthD family reductase [Pseudonocardia sp. C8]|uniref:EthD family reductase n=1 Tax=Pseudonocardia sp. C8 TaxID=2762759 RepID=UPI001642E54B|nr:EthD family reductase [Pseudonocardia sp. C8]